MAKRPRRRADQTLVCGWCSREFFPANRGRAPKWCSQVCRQRAWEQRRAARSGLAAVEIVQQVVEVEKVVQKEAVVKRVEVPVRPSRRDWPALLAELTTQLERGLVYDRDLPELATHLSGVLEVLERRPGYQRIMVRSRSPGAGHCSAAALAQAVPMSRWLLLAGEATVAGLDSSAASLKCSPRPQLVGPHAHQRAPCPQAGTPDAYDRHRVNQTRVDRRGDQNERAHHFPASDRRGHLRRAGDLQVDVLRLARRPQGTVLHQAAERRPPHPSGGPRTVAGEP